MHLVSGIFIPTTIPYNPPPPSFVMPYTYMDILIKEASWNPSHRVFHHIYTMQCYKTSHQGRSIHMIYKPTNNMLGNMFDYKSKKYSAVSGCLLLYTITSGENMWTFVVGPMDLPGSFRCYYETGTLGAFFYHFSGSRRLPTAALS